jgi:large subunit ribosomal protein L17
MRHQRIVKKFGRSTSHRKALMSSLVTNLILQSSIKTTLPKAKQARRDAEKMVTLARKGTLAARRLAASRLQSPLAVQMLFDSVVPAMSGRAGGYTRIMKLCQRRSDGSEMCLLQWVVLPAKAEAPASEPAPEAPAKKA